MFQWQYYDARVGAQLHIVADGSIYKVNDGIQSLNNSVPNLKLDLTYNP